MRFNFPLDYDLILRKKRSIKRELEKNHHLMEKKIAILGGSTTAEIKDLLEIFLLDLGIKPLFYESLYHKYFEESVFPNPSLEDFKPDIIYLHTSFVNLDLPAMKPNADDAIISEILKKFQNIWKGLSRYNCAIIQNNFEYPPYRILGNFDALQGRVALVQKINTLFAEQIASLPRVYLHDLCYLSSMMGLERYFDRALYYQAKYAMSMDGIVEVAFSLSRLINAIFGKSKKALILDLDHTCWGGVIGDDGLAGIEIGDESASGESYSAFQQYALELKQRGIILCVCSKNDLENAQEGFRHPRSVLHLEDFACFVANWEAKNTNIVSMIKTLNIGEDSLVFIDDNPSERGLVSETLKDVSVPNVGSNVVDFITHIDRNYFFETIGVSKDDLERNLYYLQNTQRITAQEKFKSYEEFLKSLEMHAEIKPFVPLYLERITQLINKTNQFNTTTKRYDFSMIEKISKSKDYITLYGKLKDRFGDNGLIAISVGRIQEEVCHLDLWLMSCRVLKRNMEYAMLDCFIDQAKLLGIKKLFGYYIRSPKNNMVADLYKNFGFRLVENYEDRSVWELLLKDYENKNFIIGVNDGKY